MKRILFALLFGLAQLSLGQNTGNPPTGNPSTGNPTTGNPTTGNPTTTPAPTTTPQSAVLIYELEFKHVAGFNVSFWRGGYVVVPAIGGTGDAVFTAFDKRKEYYLQSGKVAFYPANTDDQRYSIVAMSGGSVGANEPLLSMQSFGKVDSTISAKTENYEIKARAAKVLHGMALASRDESKLPAANQPKDGTLSFIEFSEMNLRLDEELTNRLNKRGGDLAAASREVVRLVEAAGFANSVAAPPTNGGGNNGGGNGNGGGNNNGGNNGQPTDGNGDPLVR
jgi:hypothetical protein